MGKATSRDDPEAQGAAELRPLVLRRAQRGVRSARAAFVECYQTRVYALAARMLAGWPSEVDDAVQETFVRALRALPRYRRQPNAKTSTWLLTIGTRTCLDVLRRQRRHRDDVPAADDLVSPAPRAEARVDASRLRDRVVSVMASLPDEQRAALVLRAFHDLDYPEIASALQIEIGTVKSRISRARATLRRALEDDDHG